jgi:hypothetical protein
VIAKPVNVVGAAEIATLGCLVRHTKVNRCLSTGVRGARAVRFSVRVKARVWL